MTLRNPFRRKPKWDHLAEVIGDEAAITLDMDARAVQQGAIKELIFGIPASRVTAELVIRVDHKGKTAIARYPIGFSRSLEPSQ